MRVARTLHASIVALATLAATARATNPQRSLTFFFILPKATTVTVEIFSADGKKVLAPITGRRYDAADGERLGLGHYLTEAGEGLALATQLARDTAQNSPLSNWATIHALSRIHDMSMGDGLFTESVTSALMLATPEARERMERFLGRASR